jgi:uncharacterized protein (TIGR00255 family)
MTGFGKATINKGDTTITIEIRSLNSGKGMDLSTKLPSRFREQEYLLRQSLTQKLSRGKVDLYASVTKEVETTALQLNKGVVKSYYKMLRELSSELNANDEPLFSSILKLPDVFADAQQEADLDEWNLIDETISSAVEALDQFRITEGKAIADDLLGRIKIIEYFSTHLREQDKRRTADMRQRLKNNVEQFIPKDRIDENRFEQEVIFYLEKLDITEELTRLRAHCDHFRSVIEEDKEDQKGRKLNFISQEIGREINTVGSKANDSAMQKIVVNMKDELEKIKEQTSNVL